MWPDFTNTLAWWQWAALLSVPPAIILLYFLKLKRKPLEVPSTYLWHKSIEDLHVNTIWQRLRNNLLLWLQLLLLAILILALLRPSWNARQLSGRRFIFLVDNSASMQATDVAPTRLEEAKRRVGALIDEMTSGEAAMIVSFADRAKVEQTFTDNRPRLKRSLAAIEPTQRGTDLLEALKVASGLANPGRSAEDMRDFQVAEALPATLYVLSDGNFKDVAGFQLGHLEPKYIAVGDEGAANVAVASFGVRPKESDPAALQAFAQLKNFGPEEATVSAELRLDGRLIDAKRIAIPPGESHGEPFDVGEIASGVLELAITDADDLLLDNVVRAVVTPPKPASVLLVTPGNEPLEFALVTESTRKFAQVEIESPDYLNGDAYAKGSAAGSWDLVIYDRCGPKQPPQANTFFIGALPPGGKWTAGPRVDVPSIIDIEAAHPLMQWLDLGDVLVQSATPLVPPPSGSVLIDSGAGPLMAIAPRERFEDLVLGFPIIDEAKNNEGKVERYIGTNWMTRQSFPVFVLNLFDYLGGARDLEEGAALGPGKPVPLDARVAKGVLQVRTPGGKVIPVSGDESGKASFTQADELGVYQVDSGGETVRQFAVNLFDSQESNIRPRDFAIGHVDVKKEQAWEAKRREGWKRLLLAAIGVLAAEWCVYNRRVYM
jgi:hypothetical protein